MSKRDDSFLYFSISAKEFLENREMPTLDQLEFALRHPGDNAGFASLTLYDPLRIACADRLRKAEQ